jgi:hypothetical protein
MKKNLWELNNNLRQDRFNRSLNDTQIHNQCPFCGTGSKKTVLVIQHEAALFRDESVENKRVLTDMIRQQISTVNRLVRALDTKTPMPLRTYDKGLVDSLIFQSENLTGMLSSYVIPHLEHTNNNRKKLP